MKVVEPGYTCGVNLIVILFSAKSTLRMGYGKDSRLTAYRRMVVFQKGTFRPTIGLDIFV